MNNTVITADPMTNDQFPMTNGGARDGRAVKVTDEDPVRYWSLIIGNWSFSGMVANAFATIPGWGSTP
jgi:hypothetical protein